MALQSETSRVQYNGNNSTTTDYSIPFVFFENSHIVAVVANANGDESFLSLGSGFTLTGAGNANGGSLKTTSAIPASSKLTIYREVPETQTTSYAEGGDFPASSHEKALDKVTMLVQQVRREIDRSVKVSRSANPPTDITIPSSGNNVLLSQNGNLQFDSYRPVPAYPNGNQQFALMSAGAGAAPTWQSLPSVSQGPLTASGSITPRFTEDRFGEIINVKDFGAVGNGIVDDGPAIRLAVTHLLSKTAATLHFPTGVYRISTDKNNSSQNAWTTSQSKTLVHFYSTSSVKKNICITGDSAEIVTGLWGTQGHLTVFQFDLLCDLTVRGLTFRHSWNGAGESGIKLGRIANGALVSDRNTWVAMGSFPPDYGNDWRTNPNVSTKYPKTWVTHNCKFHDFTQGFNVWWSDVLMVDRCEFYHAYGYATAYGGDLAVGIVPRQGVRDLIVTNCLYDGCVATDVTSIMAQYNDGTNIALSGMDGLVLSTSRFWMPEICTIIANNVIKHFANEGLYFQAYIENDSNWNPLQPSSQYGNHVFANNTLNGRVPTGLNENAGYWTGSGNWGIRVDMPCTNIVGNVIRECGSGIMAVSGFTTNSNGNLSWSCDNSTIQGNTVYLRRYLAQDGPSGISLTGSYPYAISKINITANSIIADNAAYALSNAWTPTNISGRLTSGLSMGGSRGLEAFVTNNVFRVMQRNSNAPNTGYLCAVNGDCGVYLDNNTFIEWDFLYNRSGGSTMRKVFGKNRLFRIRKSIPSRYDGGWGDWHFEELTQEFVPTREGWYLLIGGGRWGSCAELSIKTPAYGYGQILENQDNGTTSFQSTVFTLAAGGAYVFSGTDGGTCITQTAHAGKGPLPVSKVRVDNQNSLYTYLYVDRVLEKISLVFSGGGGSGAAGYANVVNGVITSCVVTAGGSGYTSTPTVYLLGDPQTDTEIYLENEWLYNLRRTTKAQLTAVRSGSSIASVSVANGGSGYGQAIEMTVRSHGYDFFSPAYIGAQYTANTPSGLELNFRDGLNAVSQKTGEPIIGCGIPLVGTTSPVNVVTPEYIGQQFYDKTSAILYAAHNNNSASWAQISP